MGVCEESFRTRWRIRLAALYVRIGLLHIFNISAPRRDELWGLEDEQFPDLAIDEFEKTLVSLNAKM